MLETIVYTDVFDYYVLQSKIPFNVSLQITFYKWRLPPNTFARIQLPVGLDPIPGHYTVLYVKVTIT
jgi:hypothetical protein